MGKLLDEARFYRSQGIVAIPLQPRSKLPLFHWKWWASHIPRDIELRYWFDDDSRNIGLICGGNENLVVIDFDNTKSFMWWRQKCLSSGDCVWDTIYTSGYKVETARGFHVYLKTTKRIESRELKDMGVGIRSHDHYVLCPPSIHPNGKKYEKVGAFNIYTVDDLETFLEVPPIEKKEPINLDEIWDCDLILKKEGSIIEAIKSAYPVLNYATRISSIAKQSYDGRWVYLRCISPYHEDKNPSFRIDTLNNLCTCMTPSCILYEERGLDVIALHAKMNSMSNKEAIKDLSLSLHLEGVV